MDLFLNSTNILTTDGFLVKLNGNRVASLCSGPKRVIVVAGANKLVSSLDEAIHRTRNRAGVLRTPAIRTKTPCGITGVCSDCGTLGRVCKVLLILMRKPNDIDYFAVVMVNEEIGL